MEEESENKYAQSQVISRSGQHKKHQFLGFCLLVSEGSRDLLPVGELDGDPSLEEVFCQKCVILLQFHQQNKNKQIDKYVRK